MSSRPAVSVRVALLVLTLMAGSSVPAVARDLSGDLIQEARSGDSRAVQRLLDSGADVDSRDEDGVPALAHAVYRGHRDTVQVLLDAGATMNLADRRGRTPWSWAAYGGDGEILSLFLSAGANVEWTIRGRVTALMIAALQGHRAAVIRLLQAGADPRARDENGKTAAEWAQEEGHLELARLLQNRARSPEPPPSRNVSTEEPTPGPAPEPTVRRTGDVPYLSALENAIVAELNFVRTDPVGYAEAVIAPMLERFEGRVMHFPGQIAVRTEEGVRAVQECYEVLSRAGPVGRLEPRPGLSRAAADHVRDQGPGGGFGHQGSDGSRPGDRVRRYESNLDTWGENLAYGWDDARRIVFALLVDDGVLDRAHRVNIINPRFTSVGVAVGPHARWDHMCVMAFAAFR